MTETPGEDKSTLSRGASLVPPLVSQVYAKGWKMRGTSGQKPYEWSEKFDPQSYSWKMFQASFLGMLDGESQAMQAPLLDNLPKRGIVSDGKCWGLMISAHPTIGSVGGVSGFWPTVTANEDAAGTPEGQMQAMLGNHPQLRLLSNMFSPHGPQAPKTLMDGNKFSDTDQTLPLHSPKTLSPLFSEWLMGLPIGFSDSECSVTALSQEWWQQHGI